MKGSEPRKPSSKSSFTPHEPSISCLTGFMVGPIVDYSMWPSVRRPSNPVTCSTGAYRKDVLTFAPRLAPPVRDVENVSGEDPSQNMGVAI